MIGGKHCLQGRIRARVSETFEQANEDLGQGDCGPLKGIDELGQRLSAHDEAGHPDLRLCQQPLRGFRAGHY
jgi:hypothetical protein